MKAILSVFLILSAFCFAGQDGWAEEIDSGVYEKIYGSVTTKDGVREISYEQFMKIRASQEKYLLLDVLDDESYASGHIEGALSFPLAEINEETAAKLIQKDAKIIVYCGSFQCKASTAAAQRLSEYGYKALDYKGGLKEWQQKGNKLVR